MHLPTVLPTLADVGLFNWYLKERAIFSGTYPSIVLRLNKNSKTSEQFKLFLH
jgi:hypothetical protein